MALNSQAKVRVKTINDERSAAFWAQGMSRAGKKVCLLCTTGTAAANYLPGIVEAYMSDLPLIAITCDRPWELHNGGANQTVKQKDFYKDFVALNIDIPALDKSIHAHSLLANVTELVNTCLLYTSPSPRDATLSRMPSSA